MIKLPMTIKLSEETRLQSVILAPNRIYDLHTKDDFYYITKHGDSLEVLMIITKDLWDVIFKSL